MSNLSMQIKPTEKVKLKQIIRTANKWKTSQVLDLSKMSGSWLIQKMHMVQSSDFENTMSK